MTRLEAIKKRLKLFHPTSPVRWPLDNWDDPEKTKQLHADIKLLLEVVEAAKEYCTFLEGTPQRGILRSTLAKLNEEEAE